MDHLYALEIFIRVPPSTRELYYLRMMLTVAKGSCNYDEIKTIANHKYDTFREACFAMGFLNDDRDYIEGIKEANGWGFGHFLRKLFAIMLISDSIKRPKKTSSIKQRSLKNYPSLPYPSDYVTPDLGNRLIYDERIIFIELFGSLIDIGDGKICEPSDGYVEVPIPYDILISNFEDPIDAIVQSTYPNLLDNHTNEEFLQQRAILASTIDVVDKLNEYVLQVLLGEEREYLSSDCIDRSEANILEAFDILTPEFLSSLTTFGLPNHKIKLKVGTPIILLRNLDQPEGLCNGTRLIVTKLGNHVLQAKIIYGKHIGNLIYIPRLSMSPSQSLWPFMLIRHQFQIVVSYVMTINKSQGLSLDYVGLYLPRLVFSHAQIFVALSRVKSKRDLKILIHDNDKITTKHYN
ncbi:uncharacterized protein [Cicer arietinum]|uniref:uncharacterized protein n=1 Tax=Cicer arietinum TaxID=3827 RepID=UPI003CC610F9